MKSWLSPARMFAVSLGAGLLLLAVLPAVVSENMAGWVMAGFQFVCHQLADRSPELNGVQLAACHRCFGIYAGLLFGALAVPTELTRGRAWQRHAWPIVILSTAPAALDWAAGFMGMWESGPWTRAFTGAIFGFVGGAFILAAASDLVRGRHQEMV